MGSSSSANWLTTSRFNDAGSFKNGSGSSSNSALPMPASLLRFTSSSPRTESRGILYCIDRNDRGWKGGVGEIIGLLNTSSTSDRQKIENYLAVKWGLSTSTRLGEDGTVRVVRPQVSSLEFTSGTLTIDTDKGEIAHSDGSFLLGEFTDKTFTAEDGTAYSYKISTFTADKISLGSGVVVNLMGNNPVSLRTRNNGDITLGSTINVNGGSDPSNIGGTAKAGGFNGGAKDVDGYGPGKGKTKSVSSQGGGAAYGGNGLENANGYSLTYGSPDLANHLFGGSGGGWWRRLWGRSRWWSGGTFCPWGWCAHHHFRRKNPRQWGGYFHQHSQSGGAGSGGAIRLEGGSISIAGTLEAKGGNGLTATPGGGGRIAIKTNGNLTLGTTKLDGYTPGTLHISGATATSAINLSSGTLTFDTTHGYWHHTSGVHGTGVIEQKVDNAITYKTSTFTFDSINLASGLTVKLQGENSLILKTRNHGNITVGTNLNANGGDADSNYPAHYSLIYQGLGRLGGYDGGLKNSSNGYGPGAGKLKGGGVSGNFGWRWGWYGSIGQYHANDNTFGITYGDSALAHLHGGSGAGSAGNAGGGAGGGPSPWKRTEMVPLPSSPEPPISANGGGVASTIVNGGGGGSGGSIRLAGKSITNSGSIQAKGGTPPSTTSTYDGGIGGGGRVSFSYSGNLDEGNVDVGTGAQQGTKGYNTPPEISSALTASVTYSNINYQKRSATKYDDLVLWYTFDEPDGSTAVDYSSNERNATLKNMSASNRVAGKMGGALSFDTPSTKLTSDPSGQYLDLGTWSFGGAFTLSTWIKADEWRSNGTILSLAGSEIMQLRYKSVNEGKLYFLLNGTAGGLENIDTGSVLDWGKWIHLAITLENGGTNTSTSRVYKNGTLFATATDKTTPDSAMRTPQYIGRSHYNSERYFAGDLDDFRLYNSALSAGDVSNIYAELAAGIHYQAQALNNPTGFSATGLPSGLTIDPTTGAITGHSTCCGRS